MEEPTENLRAKLATPSNHVLNFKRKNKKNHVFGSVATSNR
jgi:hypothetical protein